jgi:hypothetical protein
VTKFEIIAELQTLASARLFGPGPWLAHGKEVCAPLYRKIQELGLSEPVPGEPNAWRNTALGTELDVDLLCVFLGFFDEFEAAEILAYRGFIDNHEVDRLWDLMHAGNDPEEVLKPVVRAAYRRYLERTPLMKQRMEAELIFDHPDGRDLAVAKLTKQGFDVEILDWVDECEGVILSPTVWIKARIWTELDEDEFFNEMAHLARQFSGDVVEAGLADPPRLLH